MNEQERRREPRREFAANVEVMKDHGWIKAVARDISTAGMYLQTDLESSFVDVMTVRFLLPDSSSHLEVKGRVARRENEGAGQDSKLIGVGLEFVETTEWVLAELRSFVEGSLRSDGCGVAPIEDT